MKILAMDIDRFEKEFIGLINEDIMHRTASIDRFLGVIRASYDGNVDLFGDCGFADEIKIASYSAEVLSDYSLIKGMIANCDGGFDWELFRLLLVHDMGWDDVEDICTYHSDLYNVVVEVADCEFPWYQYDIDPTIKDSSYFNKELVDNYSYHWDGIHMGIDTLDAMQRCGALGVMAADICTSYAIYHNPYNGKVIVAGR